MITPENYYHLVRERFRAHGKPDVAQGQMAYMKHQFEFFGLKMPQWTVLAKAIHIEQGIPNEEELYSLIRLCFQDEHREMHYFGLETLQKVLKKQPQDCIYFLEELILTRSWWDTVDWVNKLVGLHFKRFPELIQPTIARWMDSGNIWLQRVCMIFQLTYKEKTDEALLFDCVRKLATSKEFFLQKGAGWALRQYGKIRPEAVQAFLVKHPVSALTKREAMKSLM
jgi:3-methyladenine DNA glycosylase AlkD